MMVARYDEEISPLGRLQISAATAAKSLSAPETHSVAYAHTVLLRSCPPKDWKSRVSAFASMAASRRLGRCPAFANAQSRLEMFWLALAIPGFTRSERVSSTTSKRRFTSPRSKTPAARGCSSSLPYVAIPHSALHTFWPSHSPMRACMCPATAASKSSVSRSRRAEFATPWQMLPSVRTLNEEHVASVYSTSRSRNGRRALHQSAQ
mmetsp:Transcript_40323/g.106833  ORF Transcript_40323/g.106833 Transcript_40323/m.106833 type:complete len:207 (-) Transcript_40323:533-1153(-)